MAQRKPLVLVSGQPQELGIGDTLLGGGLRPTAVKTANYTAAVGELVRLDSSGGAFTLTVPSSPSDGDVFGLIDVTASCATHAVALSGKINGNTDGFYIDEAGAVLLLQYYASTTDWRPMETPQIGEALSSANIAAALGYTPADDADLPTSGSYTPTVAAGTNCTAASLTKDMEYDRIGSHVFGGLVVSIDPNSTSAHTDCTVTIPVSSNFANTWDAMGTVTGPYGVAGRVYADTASDKLVVEIYPNASVAAANNYTVLFRYKVI